MLKINDKEFIFTTSVLMSPQEIATLILPEAQGLVFTLQADKLGTPLTSVEDNFKHTVNGNEVAISFPFLQNGNTMSGDYTVGTSAGELGLLFAANCVGTFMQVHLHGYWTRDDEPAMLTYMRDEAAKARKV